MCKDRSWFKHYDVVDDGLVLYMGYCNKEPVVGHGCVSLCFSSIKSLLLINVIHVPEIWKILVYGEFVIIVMICLE